MVVCAAAAVDAQDRFVAPLPADADVQVRRDVEYVADAAGRAAFDLYRPARASAPTPVVVFVNGIGAPWMRGHVQYTSWPRAVTARGLAGIAMDSREASVDDDLRRLVAHLGAHAAELGVDADRIALWSCSANVRRGLPLALGFGPAVRSAVAYYGSAQVERFPADRPLLLVRAGLDNPELNHAIDEMAALALRQNAPVEVLNLAAGVHGFDLRDDDEAARAAIRRTLDFLEATLAGGVSEAVRAGASRAAAAAAVARKDWPAAATAWQRVVAERPAASAWQRLGDAKRQLADREGALQAFEKALELGSPNRGQIGFAVAGLHAEAGDVERAFASLRSMGPLLRFFREPLATSPSFAALRADPRYEALLAGVPPAPR
jgi:tetratricopeptide (TPR) repeat protein